jgi:hypothetical protein
VGLAKVVRVGVGLMELENCGFSFIWPCRPMTSTVPECRMQLAAIDCGWQSRTNWHTRDETQDSHYQLQAVRRAETEGQVFSNRLWRLPWTLNAVL